MEQDEHNHTALRLEELNESNYEVADHQPDITGWEIVDSQRNEIGEVEDLIFDKEAMKVRYLVSSIYSETDEDSRLVLIPIGVVRLDNNEDEVILPEHSLINLNTLPTYQKGTVISPAEELAVRYAFLGNAGLEIEGDSTYQAHPEDFYNHGHFSDEHFLKK
ncbi:PRC-barrel domain-containing protein [Pedobacter metabolipauper]|uniref:PRC-barrel domain protein n=1 Tax=Pedobacter metabolipauper TaxID=425513 RepID=A0A4V3D0N4_9SPHI|nr:PRC-barrel domain-containing protein [Pedobacter metabolipauper]TDQ06205.1 PRC-barrel domain protein [Pedobacter metabolipauper]